MFGKIFRQKGKDLSVEDLSLTERVTKLEEQWRSLPYGLRKKKAYLDTNHEPIVEPGAAQTPNLEVSQSDFDRLQAVGRQKGWLR